MSDTAKLLKQLHECSIGLRPADTAPTLLNEALEAARQEGIQTGRTQAQMYVHTETEKLLREENAELKKLLEKAGKESHWLP